MGPKNILKRALTTADEENQLNPHFEIRQNYLMHIQRLANIQK